MLRWIDFGIVPILRIILISQGYYNQFHLYFLDINYHFGLIFNNFLTMLGDLSLSQNINNYLLFLLTYIHKEQVILILYLTIVVIL